MLKLAVVLAATLIVGAFGAPVANEEYWAMFKDHFNKTYQDPADEHVHRQTWKTNIQRINAHNARNSLGLETFTLGVNQFADLTSEEFVAIYNGLRMPSVVHRQRNLHTLSDADIPDTVDWRTKGVVTPVKNQGQCGSCWAFSATGSLEGQHSLKDKKLVSLSEQNLVDCSGPEGNEGCEGGLMDQAFQYIEQNHGIDTEKSYPYTAEDGTCHFKANSIGATVRKYQDVEAGSEKALTDAIATIGPISVAIDASNPSFQLYSSGVYYEPACSTSQLDHGVLAVGYGVHDSKDYYLVKNSWDVTWGMAGYIYMSRNRDNNCGIATMSSYPIV